MHEPLTPSPSLDPTLVGQLRGRGDDGRLVPDQALDGIERALGAVAARCLQLVRLQEALDASASPPDAAVRLRKAALTAREAGLAALEAARVQLAEAVSAQEQAAAGPAVPAALSGVASEIRSGLRTMGPDARRAELNAAMAAGDDLVIGAFLGAPAVASGASREDHGMARDGWRSRACPQVQDRLRRLGLARGLLERAQAGLRSFTVPLIEAEAAQRAERAGAELAAAEAALTGGA